MMALNIGLLMLALWICWYVVKFADAFRGLNRLRKGQAYRDEAFLFRHVRAHSEAMREASQLWDRR